MSGFVGRAAELEQLAQHLDLAMCGQGRLVGIVGEPGIGKSRLLYEFRQSLTPGEATYLAGQCASYGVGAPFLPILDLVRAACGIAEMDALDVVGDKLRRTLAALDLDAEVWTPFLFHLLGGPLSDQLAALSPEAVSARTLDALVRMSVSASVRQPLVMVVEDLHWIDRASEAYLASLAERLAGSRILLLVTYRSAERPSLMGVGPATQIALPPLTADETAGIARSVFGAEADEEVVRL